MKKKFAFTILIALILTVAISGIVNAQLPGTGWWTAYMVQNMGADPGTIRMTAYDSQSPSSYASDLIEINPGFGKIYDPGKSPNSTSGGPYIGFSSSLPSGFEGSLVLSGDAPLAAAAQLSNYANGSAGSASGAASGMYQAISAESADLELLFPIIKNNWANAKTSLYIQAAEAETLVTVNYQMGDGSTYTDEHVIGQYQMYMFDPSVAGVPSTLCGDDFNKSPCFGAATVTAASKIAGVVVEHPFSGSPIGAILSTRALTQGDQDTVLFAPNIKNDYYYAEATACVMNVGSAPALVRATITVTFGPNQGRTYIQDLVIQPDKTQCYSKWLNTLGGMPAGNFASARIESVAEGIYTPQELVGSTNHSKFQGSIPMGRARENHYLYTISSATTKVFTPIVKEYSDQFTGGLTVVNVGTQPARIFFEYYDYASDTVYEFWTKDLIAPNTAIDAGRVSYNDPARFENDGTWNFEDMRNKQFSVITYTNNDQKIISLTTMYDKYWAFNKFYDMMTYEGINYIP